MTQASPDGTDTFGTDTFGTGTFGTDTFTGIWAAAVRDHGDRPFLVFRDLDDPAGGAAGGAAAGRADATWTYAEFDAVVARVAGTLRERGVRAGDPVHLVLRNCPAFVALWVAVSRLGAWMVPVDPASVARDIASQVRRVAPAVAVLAAARAGVYAEGAAGRVAERIELAEDVSDLAPGAPLLAGAPVAPQPVRSGDRLAVMFTSGTTSEPKGVVLTQACYASVATTMAGTVSLRPHHRWWVTLPMFHANGQYYCFAPAIAAGASVALASTFSASRWVSGARAVGATHASLFAAPIRMILARCPQDETPLSLEHVWFAQSLGAEHHARFAELVGTPPRQLYGMTETVAVVTADANRPPVHDVMGVPVGDRQVRLLDPATETDAAPGVPGQLLVRGRPGADLFAEYLDDPATTGRAFTEIPGTGEVWFATGDLAVAAPDAGSPGSLRFVGRVDDVIKVSGENVSLTEVEAAAAQAPGVLEVAVLGRPDPLRDQVPVAYVVAKDPQQPPTADELGAWAATHLPPAARPREWHLIDALPRTGVGKVRRFRISN
ncbi:class I adenylate-forming enzyme family protein [Nakamurella leprariae]|uniref:AMP-binding protein n=1 Tax=Nakamurella leprariae TaxID=2803911 RepID=A0A938YCH1_9ACTN|nr:AMP-binding protein [Nakamurella leprariae]MBM9467061.1 AMP-binding protein [Nakamurella leprariae]